jgi:hypothetical protein
MNSLSPYHSTSTAVLLKRFRLWKRQYLHVIIYTSLFWIFVDVFFIMLFSDCTKEIVIPCSSSSTNNYSKSTNHNLARRHPKIIIDQITKASPVRKWWEVDAGLNLIINKKKTKKKNFYIIGATNPVKWHGEGGRGVVIPPELQEESKKRFTENQFNILASDLMALNRSIKDQRSARLKYFFI